jgi:hypothetical protein
MPSYMFLLYDAEVNDEEGYENSSPEDWAEAMRAHGRFAEEVVASGAKILAGQALQSTTRAKTRRRAPSGESIVTDGPYAEVKEGLGGFYLIETTDFEAALALADLCPGSTVEVRPVLDTSG